MKPKTTQRSDTVLNENLQTLKTFLLIKRILSLIVRIKRNSFRQQIPVEFRIQINSLVSLINNQINSEKIMNQLKSISNHYDTLINLDKDQRTNQINYECQYSSPSILPMSPLFQQQSEKSNQTTVLAAILKSKCKQNNRFEEWTTKEVARLFEIYQEHGSKWKNFQQYFPDRSTNSIKNRFYTALRNTCKALFKEHEAIQGKLPHEIPSKSLVRLYEGREEFERFGTLGKEIMIEMNYTAHPKIANKVCKKYSNTLLNIFTIIYELELPATQEDQVKSSIQNSNSKQPIIPEPIKVPAVQTFPPIANENNFMFYPYMCPVNQNYWMQMPMVYYLQ